MSVKKLFIDYEARVREIISLWREEINQSQILGNKYFESVASAVTQEYNNTREKYNFVDYPSTSSVNLQKQSYTTKFFRAWRENIEG